VPENRHGASAYGNRGRHWFRDFIDIAVQIYNQVIAGHHYLTQEEFSNQSFFKIGGGCLQSP
jgi:hypothetical protein